jgi:hypothetical protein
MMSRILFLFVSVATFMVVITLNGVSTSSPICYEVGKKVSAYQINMSTLRNVHS